jgi:hypothetical protein
VWFVRMNGKFCMKTLSRCDSNALVTALQAQQRQTYGITARHKCGLYISLYPEGRHSVTQFRTKGQFHQIYVITQAVQIRTIVLVMLA